METKRWERLQELFKSAVEMEATAQAAFVDAQCGDDAEMREQLQSLLSHDASPGFSVQGAIQQAAGESAFAKEAAAPSQIGPYRILRRVGRGGMGEVFEAEQTHPVQRRVALKRIRTGMDSAHVLARFEIERQILARMDHPAIARVFDAGSTEDELPYFVMEFVEGVPIDEYADANQLGTRDRLHLFNRVCEAVQHAHQKGVIHRDLKPNNILVQTLDGRAQPKVIDFGIAKATEATDSIADGHSLTQVGQIVGTPEFMSPEQLEMNADIDTRADVYALGVLLYKLLVGAMPYEKKPGVPLSIDDVRRRLRESDPSVPSRRLSSLGEGSQEIALSRGTNFRNLQRALREDLDWIVMKAIERERERRYDSASELVADIERHLNDEPVLAGPPKASYRIGKFVRRHRGGVGVALLLLTILTGSAIVLAIQARTVAKQRDAIAAERDLAQREQARAEKVTEFLTDIFGEASPESNLGETVTAREILDRGAAQIEEDLADEPELQVELMAMIARVYRRLGLFDPALKLGERAVELADQELQPEDRGSKLARLRLADLYYDLGQYDRAEQMFLALREQLEGRVDPNDWYLYSASVSLVSIYRRTDRLDEGEALIEEQLEIIRSADEPDAYRELRFLSRLGAIQVRRKEYDKAERTREKVLEMSRELDGEDSTNYLAHLGGLANVYWHQERWEKVEPLYVQIREAKERIYGVDHPSSIIARTNLGRFLVRVRRMEEGTPLLRRSLKESRALYGETHPKVRSLLWDLGLIAANMDRPEEMMEMLTAHLEAGGLGRPLIEHPDFDPYRGDPEFERLVAIARARADERHTY